MTLQSYVLLLLSVPLLAAGPNALTKEEKQAGWKLLFDGKSFRNWQDPTRLTPPADGWTIVDGCIKTVPHPRITEDLISADKYRNFELAWEWKIAEGGNSGVKYGIQAIPIITEKVREAVKRFEDQVDAAMKNSSFDRKVIGPGEHAQIYTVGFEYQMIDNARHADAKRGPKYQTGALYGMIEPTQAAAKQPGEWNSSRLIVNGDHLEHWLNGVKVLDASLKDPAIAEASAKRWGAGSPVYKLLTERPAAECHITLQNHGDEAWFRNLKLRRLK